MREQLHLDADSLNAFIEGVLPEHERAQCLAHLAECARCRDVVFLAQDVPVSPAAPIPISTRRRWFQPIPLLAAAAAVCVAIIGTWLYLRSGPEARQPELTARLAQAPLSPPDNRVETPGPKPGIPEASASARLRSAELPAQNPPPAPVKSPEAPRIAPPPPAAETARSKDSSAAQTAAPLPPQPSAIVAQTEAVPSGISGTVTDPSGAIVPQATVELRQLAGNNRTSARTDPSGEFKFSGLAPGQYELQITAPGFRQATQRVEVQPQQMAAVTARLEVGSQAETVQVEANASVVQTQSSQLGRSKKAAPTEAPLLSPKLPARIEVKSGKIVLSVDSEGAIFFSGNSGKSWKAIKSPWTGKVASVVTPPALTQDSKALFQLTTDSGSVWLSRDGRRWYPAPPPQR